MRQELAQLFADGIAKKGIYLFSSTHLNTDIPHYFICIVRTDGDLLYMTCCTSQFETVRRFVETRPNIPETTLVWISPKNNENPFTKDTYVNCNSVFVYSVEDLTQMYLNEEITYKGEISDIHYEQLLIGVNASPLVDEEIKEFIPNSIDDTEIG